MIILLAVLALVVVKALAESPWGVFTVGATIPIAMLMGGYLRFVARRQSDGGFGHRRRAAAAGGLGRAIRSCTCAALARSSSQLQRRAACWAIIVYGFAASVLPVWLLLAPRDYLSTFMKLGTIFALALGVFFVLPDLQMPAITQVHRRLRSGRAGQALSVLFHHHRVRRDQRFSHADLQRHHAEDHHARKLCASDRLRRDVPGIAGRDHGDDRRLHARTRRLPGMNIKGRRRAQIVGVVPKSRCGIPVDRRVAWMQLAQGRRREDRCSAAPAARRRSRSAWRRFSRE